MDEPASALPPGSSGGTPPPIPPVITATPAPPSPPRRNGCNGWRTVAIIAIVLFGMTFLMLARHLSRGVMRPNHASRERTQKVEEVVIEESTGDKKIAVIDVSGIITSSGEKAGMNMPESIREQFKAAKADDDVRAVILKINSPGGEVLAADEINATIKDFQEKSKKPVIASMGTLAASGGYYVAAPCRWIVANELTITGSIGVIMHAYNYRGLMNKVGLRPETFKSGKFKDMLSGEKEPDLDKLSTEDRQTRLEERRMVQDLIDETFNRFKEVVKSGRDNAEKRNRGSGKALSDNWTDYADGRVFSGKQALELGFVDENGNLDVAVSRAKQIAHITNATLIQYREPFDFSSLFRLFGKAETPAMKVDLGISLPRLHAGQLYYIFPSVLN
jgi:protease-4